MKEFELYDVVYTPKAREISRLKRNKSLAIGIKEANLKNMDYPVRLFDYYNFS